MVTIIFVYFFWQIEEAQKTFLYYVREHTRIISEAIKQNAENLDRIEKNGQAPAGLSHVFNRLSGISGISYVKIEPGPHKDTGGLPGSDFLLVDNNKIAETRINFGKDMLVVGLDTAHFLIREKQLVNELFVFSAIIAFISAFFSWLIYLYQRTHIEQARAFERKLAKENEDAALGRAAATITHEIRNPLNAIHMGLQRIQIETEGLNEDHHNLISTILRAVKRTNGIVTHLRRYAAPLRPNSRQVDLTSIVQNMLTLYQQQCSDQAISVTFESRNDSLLAGDSDLLEEVVENLIKNAIEAQPDGGYLKISVFKQESHLVLLVENSGYDLSEKETENILEPYFTTKTRGSGLGLAIAKRIVLAHGGRIEVEIPAKGTIRISAYLPLIKGG
jgi:signal transduction histidine kinase